MLRRLFPAARLIAVELDKQNAHLCRLSHQSDGLATVVHVAVWSGSRHVRVRDVGDGLWAFPMEPHPLLSARIETVQALTYERLLTLHGLRFVA